MRAVIPSRWSSDLASERLARLTPDDPLRVLSGACLLGHKVGWDDRAYPSDALARLASNDKTRVVPFCPEDRILGTPRLLTTVHDGKARVLDTKAISARSRTASTSRRP